MFYHIDLIFRNDYNGLRYQLAVVQSEFESEQKKAETTIEELRLKFDAEKNRLQRERDEAVAQCLKVQEGTSQLRIAKVVPA